MAHRRIDAQIDPDTVEPGLHGPGDRAFARGAATPLRMTIRPVIGRDASGAASVGPPTGPASPTISTTMPT